MIQFEHVSKRFEGFTLSDISFQLPKGYIMGLVGANGSGKTTILKLLLGVYQPDHGRIQVDERTMFDSESEVKDKLGYVMAEDLFFDNMTLEKNAEVFGKYYSDFSKDRFLEFCKEFKLLHNEKLKSCSKGEKLKFQFAFALSHNPKILVLDEPTASFDPEFREEFQRVITQFVSDGEHSVILASHLLSELDRIADYITIIDHGKMVVSMEQETLRKRYRMVSGENYKINLLPPEDVIYKEKRTYATNALVRHHSYTEYASEMSVTIPSLEDFLYYATKGGFKNVRISDTRN